MIEVVALCRVFFSVLFISTALDKVLNKDKAKKDIKNYNLIPAKLINISFYFIVSIHFIIGVLFLFNWQLLLSISVGVFLIAIYTFAIAFNLIKHKKFDCGCEGIVGDNSISWTLVWRNILMLALLVSLLYSESQLSILNFYYFSFFYIVSYFIKLIKAYNSTKNLEEN